MVPDTWSVAVSQGPGCGDEPLLPLVACRGHPVPSPPQSSLWGTVLCCSPAQGLRRSWGKQPPAALAHWENFTSFATSHHGQSRVGCSVKTVDVSAFFFGSFSKSELKTEFSQTATEHQGCPEIGPLPLPDLAGRVTTGQPPAWSAPKGAERVGLGAHSSVS